VICPYDLLLRHEYGLQKSIKSITELVMFKDKEMEGYAVYITCETFCEEGMNKVAMAHI
jgi:hypothetical protein